VPHLEEGIKDCDVIIMLRLQNERMSGALLPSHARILQELRPHAREAATRPSPTPSSCTPAPSTAVWKSTRRWWTAAQAVILPQVTFGIAVRMAVMSIVAGNEA